LKWDGVKDFKLEETIKGTSHFGKCIKAYANWVLHNEPFFNTIEESSKVLRLISALYIPGLGGARTEDQVVIKKNGFKSLTNSKKYYY
ncbi:unnamed protein product, partial [marine sediment metagenome]